MFEAVRTKIKIKIKSDFSFTLANGNECSGPFALFKPRDTFKMGRRSDKEGYILFILVCCFKNWRPRVAQHIIFAK